MKNTPQKNLTTLLLFSVVLFFNAQESVAWSGTDLKNNSTIEIETGNLVREGSIIDFYDSSSGNYHTGKVLIMNSVSRATEITIEDFNNDHQERLFLMEE